MRSGEVKTLAIGTVCTPVQEQGEWVVHTEELSSCSRLTDAEGFGHLALVETHQRGTEAAKTVCAVNNGAEWMQGFVDLHQPNVVRILAFPHALGNGTQAGQAVYGESTAAFTQWFATQRRTLQHGNPTELLEALQRLAVTAHRPKADAAAATVWESFYCLEKQWDMLPYA
jgi:hypothetical protein